MACRDEAGISQVRGQRGRGRAKCPSPRTRASRTCTWLTLPATKPCKRPCLRAAIARSARAWCRSAATPCRSSIRPASSPSTPGRATHAGLFDVSHMGPSFLRLVGTVGDAEFDHHRIAEVVEPLVTGRCARAEAGAGALHAAPQRPWRHHRRPDGGAPLRSGGRGHALRRRQRRHQGRRLRADRGGRRRARHPDARRRLRPPCPAGAGGGRRDGARWFRRPPTSAS